MDTVFTRCEQIKLLLFREAPPNPQKKKKYLFKNVVVFKFGLPRQTTVKDLLLQFRLDLQKTWVRNY